MSLDIVVGHARVVLTTSRVLAGMGHAAVTAALFTTVVLEADRAAVGCLAEQVHLAERGTFVLLSLTGSLSGPFTSTFSALVAVGLGGWISLAVAPPLLGRAGLPAVFTRAVAFLAPAAG